MRNPDASSGSGGSAKKNKKSTEAKVPKKRVVRVSSGERAGSAKLKPLEFKFLQSTPTAHMGDLQALDETIRHMRDKLPDVTFSMGLVRLKGGKTVSTVGGRKRIAIVVRIDPPTQSPIVLLDVERTGIEALSLMALRFRGALAQEQIEKAVQKTLNAWVESGGHWSGDVETSLQNVCDCQRLPKVLIPRDEWKANSQVWAMRLLDRLRLA